MKQLFLVLVVFSLFSSLFGNWEFIDFSLESGEKFEEKTNEIEESLWPPKFKLDESSDIGSNQVVKKDLKDLLPSLKQGETGANSPKQPACVSEFFRALTLTDWLNTSIINNFGSKTQKKLQNNELCYINLESYQDITIWLGPRGFYSNYQPPPKENKKLDFSLATVGIDLGGELKLLDFLSAGIGMGYYYSKLKWKICEGSAELNGVFVGPYATFWFPQGYLSTAVYWAGNFYNQNIELYKDQKIKANTQSWDIVAQLEGKADLPLPETFISNSCLQPSIRLDYLNVFLSSEFNNHKSGKLKLKDSYSAYLRFQPAFGFTKTFMCTKSFFLLPSVALGWVYMLSLSNKDLIIEDTQPFKLPIQKKPQNQFSLDIELAAFYSQHLMFGLKYESLMGSNTTTYSGKLWVEWSW